jgi:hypothetical protein
MRKKSIGRALALAGIATLALAVSAGAAPGGNGKAKAYGKLAAKECAKEKKALGKEAFDALYGTPSMPNCIGVTKPEAKQASKGASQDCRAERDEIGAEAFAEKYGSNKNKKNAFGKCVSGKAKAELSEDNAEKVNAAKECKAEQADPNFAAGHDGKTFDEFYGTNPNKKNAFGKCVSGKVKDEEETPPVPTP